MESYEEKYKQALENAKQGKTIEEIFPELKEKESEDEKIRKWLLERQKEWLHDQERGGYMDNKNLITSIRASISWLEKQKPAEWSEEDEHRRKDAIYFLETARKHYADTSEIELTVDWLKSLKPQYRWRPSNEEMVALSKAIEHAKSHGFFHQSELKDLYDKLRKFI